MVENEAVTARSPPGQVLLPSDICHRGVQHTSTTALHAWGKTRNWSLRRCAFVISLLIFLDFTLTWTSNVCNMAKSDLVDSGYAITENDQIWFSVCIKSWIYKYVSSRRTLHTSQKAGGSPCWRDSWWSKRLAALHRGNKTPCRNLWWSLLAGCSSPSS